MHFIYLVSVHCVCARIRVQCIRGGHRTTCRNWFFSSIMWGQEIELQIVSLGGKYLCSLSHSTFPTPVIIQLVTDYMQRKCQ